MKAISIFLITFGVIVIIFPQILSILLGLFFIFLWINILVASKMFKNKKWEGENYIKFGKYKIYR